MSALARLTVIFGGKVTGSDNTYSSILQGLTEISEISFWVGSNPEKIGTPDCVVYSSAIPENDPELSYCRAIGCQAMERPLFLNKICEKYQTVIAISGTHGKTTTCAMLTSVFLCGELPFTAHFGGEYPPCGNLFFKGTDYFITEACEYKRNLLLLPADIALTLNAENDHPDTYNSLSDIYETFLKFLAQSKNKLSIINSDCELFKKYRPNEAVTFGMSSEAEYEICEMKKNKRDCYDFSLNHFGKAFISVSLSVNGFHNIYNAAAAAVIADKIRLPKEAIERGLNEFSGVRRRFEKIGEVNEAPLYSDYAHHPTEIKAAIKTALELLPSRLLVIFQPHTYSRTASLIQEFCTCFEGSDELYIIHEYAARETADFGCSAFQLYKLLKKEGVFYYEKTLPLVKRLFKTVRKGDILLVLGAGDIDNICRLLV